MKPLLVLCMTLLVTLSVAAGAAAASTVTVDASDSVQRILYCSGLAVGEEACVGFAMDCDYNMNECDGCIGFYSPEGCIGWGRPLNID